MTEDLYALCKEKAKNHSSYFHYSTFDTLIKILFTKSIRLTQLSLVNDIEEESRINSILKNKVFAACFNHHCEESIPLWNMYSKDGYGIRIGFNNISFFENLNNYFIMEGSTRTVLPNKFWEVRDASVVDISYVENPYDHVNFHDPLNTGAKIPYPTNIGLVKRTVWNFEAETRARVYVDVTKNVSSVLYDSDFPGVRYPDFEYVFCSLSEEDLKNMKITFHPYMSKEVKYAVVQTVSSLIPEFNQNNFFDSILENKIRM